MSDPGNASVNHPLLLAGVPGWDATVDVLIVGYGAAGACAALEAARESEARWRAGRPLSAIDGVPVTPTTSSIPQVLDSFATFAFVILVSATFVRVWERSCP